MSTAPVTLCCSYAFLECLNEKTAYELSEKYKDAEINGEKLYVIQAISEKKDKFGKQHCVTYIDVRAWHTSVYELCKLGHST